MEEASHHPERTSKERSPSSRGEGERLWRWVFFSGLLHLALIFALFVIPRVPSRRPPSYPVYTVDLVGGEKIGGGGLSPVLAAPPAAAKETTGKLKEKTPVKEEVKKAEKREKKVAKSVPEEVEVVLKKRKVETSKSAEKPVQQDMAVEKTKKEEIKEREGLPDHVREKLIQAALERVKSRAAQKKPDGQELGAGPGQGEGAAARGVGGTGGGIVKGLEFVRYYNLMRSRIKERWTWVGKRSDLEVTVRFAIQENGEIAGLRIIKASGDASYDDSVIRAVQRSSPLPRPPEKYQKDFMDVELTFRPKDLGG